MRERFKYLAFLFFVLLSACHHQEPGPPVKAIDIHSIKPDPEIQVMEKDFSEGFTGIVPKYYGEDSSRLECLMFVENGELKTRYFFDRLQRLQEEDHYDFSAMHGIQKRFYPSGHIKESLEMEHGIRNGLHVSYYDNGHVKAKETWKQGKRQGRIVAYDSLGEFSYEAPGNQYEALFLK
jgi:antitoxin component YwqK of YwqJK toxin-antitoxin module